MIDVESYKRVIVWKKIVMYIIIVLVIVQGDNYTNYKYFEVLPKTEREINLIRSVDKAIEGLQVTYRNISQMDMRINIMVPLSKLAEFYNSLEATNVTYNILITDVQEVVDSVGLRLRSKGFIFQRYPSLYEIYEDLHNLATQYPDKVQIVVGGRSFQGRRIEGVKVSFKANNPGIFIQGGINGNEWISPVTVMFILHQLLTSNDIDVRKLAEKHDWYIFPLFNPDGYRYTHTTNRLWRKTLKPYDDNLCFGASLDRNWHKCKDKDNDGDICSDDYPGSEQFSEIEAKSMSEYIKTISDKFYAYISFRSYGQRLLYPYNFVEKDLSDVNKTYHIAKSAVEALKQRYGTNYTVGHIYSIKNVVTGCIVDYIQKTYGKRHVFEYHLRDRGHYGFLLPTAQIIPTGEETLDSLVALFREIAK